MKECLFVLIFFVILQSIIGLRRRGYAWHSQMSQAAAEAASEILSENVITSVCCYSELLQESTKFTNRSIRMNKSQTSVRYCMDVTYLD